MTRYRTTAIGARRLAAAATLLALGTGVAFAVLAQPGGMMHGGAMGMHGMGMHGRMQQDAAGNADMGLVHRLLADHDRIRRTVTRLPDGIRTVTESDDPQVAQTIQAHVASMVARLADGREFNMFSSTVPVLFENARRIATRVENTAKGSIVTQTSSDRTVVAALQGHADEVSELARDGMAAMRRSAMAAMGGGRHSLPGALAPAARAQTQAPPETDRAPMDHAAHMAQTAQARRQAEVSRRGPDVMPFSLPATTHVFTRTAQGGVQKVIAKDAADAVQVQLVRRHLQEIRTQFLRGDFSGPAHIHGRNMPGLAELRAAKTGQLAIAYQDTPDGAELTYTATDATLVQALHKWFDAQLSDHGRDAMAGPARH